LETKSGKWVKNWQLLGLGLILLFSSFVGFAYYFFTDSCESFDNANIIVEPQNPVPNQIIKEKKSR
ncbi:MAG: hypothetical protein KAH84_13170, partial [Thiomargarita sp.]|nr:hypothetical protein [Thiomargarita sp.]